MRNSSAAAMNSTALTEYISWIDHTRSPAKSTTHCTSRLSTGVRGKRATQARLETLNRESAACAANAHHVVEPGR
eukprot:8893052-Alexandrium_andersonii.AAC.1